jgi:hypothetical protein
MTLDRQVRPGDFDGTHNLLAALERIEMEGWNGPTGGALLGYVRREVVKPVVRGAGLSGPSAEFAEATGWSVAWETLAGPAIRSANSPWGLLAVAVRRAVLSDRVAERYRTAAWRAWRIERFLAAGNSPARAGEWREVADPHALAKPLSLTVLVDQDGFDRPTADDVPNDTDPGNLVGELVAVLVRGGWAAADAREVVLHVADHAHANSPDSAEVPGWRHLALSLGVPPWQARRVTALLLGAPGWPGLVERIATGGPSALRGPVIDAAVRATRDDSMRTPARTALTVEAQAARRDAMAS